MSELLQGVVGLALVCLVGAFSLSLAVAFVDNTCARGAPWRFPKHGEL